MREQGQRQEEGRGQHEEERTCGDNEQRGDILAAAGEEQDERVAKDGAQRQIELRGKWDGIHAEGKDRIDPEQQENQQRHAAGVRLCANAPAEIAERKPGQQDAAGEQRTAEADLDVAEKVAKDMDILFPLHAEQGAAERGERGRNRHDRDAAEQKGQIQQDEIDPVIPDDLREGFHKRLRTDKAGTYPQIYFSCPGSTTQFGE